MAIIYYIGGKFSFEHIIEDNLTTITIFFAEGFALAGVLIFGRKLAIGIFIGQFLLSFNSDMAILPSVLIALTHTLEAILAHYLIGKFRVKIDLSEIRDLYLFIGMIIFVTQPFNSIMGNMVLLHFNYIQQDALPLSLLSLWFGNGAAQLFLSPILLVIYNNFYNINFKKLFIISLFFGLLSYYFSLKVPFETMSVLFTISIVPLIFVLTHKHGLIYTFVPILVTTIISLYASQNQLGIFSTQSSLDTININFYIVFLLCTMLIIGVLFIEREQSVIILSKLNTILNEKVEREVAKNREKDKFILHQSRQTEMGELISMIAHQWRQPLNNLSIINQTMYIKYQKNKLDDKLFDKLHKNSTAQIKQMSRTIDDFRDFFKPDKETINFNINKVIQDSIYIIKPALAIENIKLTLIASEEIHIDSYPHELGQAILNILNNAKDILVERAIKEKKITISIEKNGDKTSICINDNAGGVEDNIIDNIFNPYFSTKDNNCGTGLGLYMSKIIIENNMKGQLSVKNEEEGASFKILL